VVDSKKVKVIAPTNKPAKEIREIVKLNSKWIFQKQLKLREQKNTKLLYLDGSKLPYLGRKYPLQILDVKKNDDDNKLFYLVKGRFVAKTNSKDPNHIRNLYENWLENRATNFLKSKVKSYSKMLGIDEGMKIKIKSHKNRLGSLGKNLTLNFNKNLLRLPSRIIDYVVAHELCHAKIPNHSPAYWRLLALVMPDYKKKKEWLETNKQFIIS
jgi:predicted metal-dependent hydrolase